MLHELVHGRYSVFEIWVEEVTEDLEEDMINDFSEGIMKFNEDTFEK